ncbi:MAG: DUF6599 family protein [Terracidiphilus sp.]
MRSVAIFVLSSALLGAAASAQSAPPAPRAPETATHLVMPPAPVSLPQVFDGWVEAGKPAQLGDAQAADPASAAALKEYGFTEGAQNNYKRGGETLTLRALRFGDVSGAYGAYSFYRQNGWPRVDIGTGAASDNNRVIFWVGTTVVEAKFSRVGPMSAGELREIARAIPHPTGNLALLPPILAFLPQGSLAPRTTHYAEGPAGYAGSGGVLPPQLVGFDRDAETVTANYSLSSGTATLTIINYPTPQMAAAMLPKIRAYLAAGSKAQPPWPSPLQNSDQASLEVRASGPLLAIVSGDAIPDESHRLVEMVHYTANLITIPQSHQSEISKTSQLLMGIAGLVLVGSAAAILLGFFLGGGRALWRIAHGRPASSVYDEEFIRIDLKEKWVEPAVSAEGPHPKG